MSLYPGESCFEVLFCSILCIVTFLYSFVSCQQFNCFKSIFYKLLWYYLEGCLTKQTFLQHLTLWLEQFWGILGPIWGMLFNFRKLLRILSYKTLYRYLYSQFAKKYFKACIPLLGVIFLILNDFRILKQSLDILHECYDITVMAIIYYSIFLNFRHFLFLVMLQVACLCWRINTVFAFHFHFLLL